MLLELFKHLTINLNNDRPTQISRAANHTKVLSMLLLDSQLLQLSMRGCVASSFEFAAIFSSLLMTHWCIIFKMDDGCCVESMF